VENYPTIVNNVPQSNKTYNNTLEAFANMDNALAKAQGDIGESSNLAQICLTYMYNFDDEIYEDALCILSVLAQISIDNAKRVYAVNVANEISYLKQQLNVKENKYPIFWLLLHPNFNRNNINSELVCPMNYLYSLKLQRFRNNEPTIPMSEFFVKHPTTKSQKQKNRKVEEFIEKYSIDLFNYNTNNEEDVDNEYLLLSDDFDDMVTDIQSMYISSNYLSLFSWLIDRAFLITSRVIANKESIGIIKKNKSLLLKTLYAINKKNFLECFKEES
jgi:hypothetical protein